MQTLGWWRDMIIKKPEELYNAVHLVMNIMYDLLNCLATQELNQTRGMLKYLREQGFIWTVN